MGGGDSLPSADEMKSGDGEQATASMQPDEAQSIRTSDYAGAPPLLAEGNELLSPVLPEESEMLPITTTTQNPAVPGSKEGVALASGEAATVNVAKEEMGAAAVAATTTDMIIEKPMWPAAVASMAIAAAQADLKGKVIGASTTKAAARDMLPAAEGADKIVPKVALKVATEDAAAAAAITGAAAEGQAVPPTTMLGKIAAGDEATAFTVVKAAAEDAALARAAARAMIEDVPVQPEAMASIAAVAAEAAAVANVVATEGKVVEAAAAKAAVGDDAVLPAVEEADKVTIEDVKATVAAVTGATTQLFDLPAAMTSTVKTTMVSGTKEEVAAAIKAPAAEGEPTQPAAAAAEATVSMSTASTAADDVATAAKLQGLLKSVKAKSIDQLPERASYYQGIMVSSKPPNLKKKAKARYEEAMEAASIHSVLVQRLHRQLAKQLHDIGMPNADELKMTVEDLREAVEDDPEDKELQVELVTAREALATLQLLRALGEPLGVLMSTYTGTKQGTGGDAQRWHLAAPREPSACDPHDVDEIEVASELNTPSNAVLDNAVLDNAVLDNAMGSGNLKPHSTVPAVPLPKQQNKVLDSDLQDGFVSEQHTQRADAVVLDIARSANTIKLATQQPLDGLKQRLSSNPQKIVDLAASRLEEVTVTEWELASPHPSWCEDNCKAERWLLQTDSDICKKPKSQWIPLLEALVGGANGRDATTPLYFLVKTPLQWEANFIICDMFKELNDTYALCSLDSLARTGVGHWVPWNEPQDKDPTRVFAVYHITEHADRQSRWSKGERWFAFRVNPVGSKSAVVMKAKWRPGATTSLRQTPLWELGPAQVFLDQSRGMRQGVYFAFDDVIGELDQFVELIPEGKSIEYKGPKSMTGPLMEEKVTGLMEEVIPSMVRSSPKFKLTIGVIGIKGVRPHLPIGYSIPPGVTLSDLKASILKRLENRWKYCTFPSALNMEFKLQFFRVLQPHDAKTTFYGPVNNTAEMTRLTKLFNEICRSKGQLISYICRNVDNNRAVVLLNTPFGGLSKYVIGDDEEIIPRYVLEIEGETSTCGTIPVGVLRQNMFINHKLQVGRVVVELHDGRLYREPAMHAWLRINHSPTLTFSTVMFDELHHRCVLSTERIGPTLDHWTRTQGGDVIGDSEGLVEFLSARASTFCVLVVCMNSIDDCEFWATQLNNLRTSKHRKERVLSATRHWKIILVSKWGSYISQFESKLRYFAANRVKDTIEPTFTVYDARLSENLILREEEDVAILSQSPGISAAPASDTVRRRPASEEVIANAQNWIKAGSEVPWAVIEAGLVGQAPTKLQSKLASKVCDVLHKVGIFKELYMWKKHRVSGASTLLRASVYEVKQRILSATCITLTAKQIDFEKLKYDLITGDLKELFVCIDDTVENLDAHQFMLWAQDFAISAVVVQVVQSHIMAARFYKWRVGHTKNVSLSPIVAVDCIPGLVENLTTLYPGSKETLLALQQQFKEKPEALSKSERNIHNFVLTGVHNITVPISQWISSQREHCLQNGVSDQLITFISLMSAFTEKRGILLQVVSRPVGDNPLVISKQVANMMLAPGNIFVQQRCLEPEGTLKTEIRIWSTLVSEHILNDLVRRKKDIIAILANLLKLLSAHSGASTVALVLRYLIIDAKPKLALLSPILNYHQSSGGTWKQLNEELRPAVSSIEDNNQYQHILIALSRSSIYYQEDSKKLALEMAEKAIRHRGEDDTLIGECSREVREVEKMAWNNYATLCLACERFNDASEIFCKILEQHDETAAKKTTTMCQAWHGKQVHQPGQPATTFFYKGLKHSPVATTRFHKEYGHRFYSTPIAIDPLSSTAEDSEASSVDEWQWSRDSPQTASSTIVAEWWPVLTCG